MAEQQIKLPQKLLAEFVGTYLLIFTIGCNVLSQTQVWAGVSIACVLMVSIYAFGGISGANFNPAVSFAIGSAKAMGFQGGMGWAEVITYSVVQLAAGAVAGLSYHGLFGQTFALAPAKGFGFTSVASCEFWYTFMLCFVVLNVAVAYATTPNQYYGLAIGFVIVAGAYGAGAVSGGCFNPAVAFGIAAGSFQASSFWWFLAYSAVELLGAVFAAAIFKLVRPGEFEAGGTTTPATLGAKLTSEFFGTFMLVYTVGLNVLGKSPAGAFSIAASLMCMIYALGDVSGAHFNPAVSLAIFCSGLDSEFSGKNMALYMCVQIAGGIIAAFSYAYVHFGNTFPLGPGAGFTWTQVAIAEVVFTFVLCLVVLCAAVAKKTRTRSMKGLAIGSCVTVGGFAIGSISGGSLNPAVSCGIAASQLLNGGFFFKAFFYAAFEFIGAALAAGVVMVTHKDTEKE